MLDSEGPPTTFPRRSSQPSQFHCLTNAVVGLFGLQIHVAALLICFVAIVINYADRSNMSIVIIPLLEKYQWSKVPLSKPKFNAPPLLGNPYRVTPRLTSCATYVTMREAEK